MGTVSEADGLMRLYFGASAFGGFYPVEIETVRSIVGEDSWRHMTTEDAEESVENLDRLFTRMGDGNDAAWNNSARRMMQP